MNYICTSLLIGKCEMICRKKSSKNFCSVEMKDVVLIQIRYHCNFSWPLHTSFPSFSLICWTSLFRILGFILCSTINPPAIICHFPNWVFFLLLSLQCNAVSLLTLFLISHHPFFLHLPWPCQMFCNLLMLRNSLSLPLFNCYSFWTLPILTSLFRVPYFICANFYYCHFYLCLLQASITLCVTAN